MKSHHWPLVFAVVLPTLLPAATVAPSWEHPPHQQTRGVFWREHWYARGLTNGNPSYERRFRINSPEASLHPIFGRRVEARENGLMLIQCEEDLFQITGAEFYAELWGGHPGTANKRVTMNGRSTYQLPRAGTENGHCTYPYPVLPLRITDLVNGWNAVQWALDQGTTFWGHALVDNACLRVALTNGHADLVKLGLHNFEASVDAAVSAEGEGVAIKLNVDDSFVSRIARVDFQAWYSGYDENGDLRDTDWHGFTKNREPMAYVGARTSAPFDVTWDTSMIPAQKNVAGRALVRFKDTPGLVFVTEATRGLAVAERRGRAVALYAPPDLPPGFWSRANQRKSCSLVLDVEPSRIERAELCVITWTGGAGEVKDYFRLNGRHFPVAEGHRHEIQFNRIPIEPALLRPGTNTIELLSDTLHHGIEVIYPGPALMVRYRF